MDYDKFNDNDILEKYKNGDLEAPIFLIKKYKPLVKLRARSYFLVGGDEDDIIQEGMIGLFKAIRDFDISKNVTFKTFANLCINRQIINAIKSDNRFKNKPLNNSYSLNTYVDSDETYEYIELVSTLPSDNPEDIFISNENKLILEEHIEKQLTSLEKKVLFHYLSGKNYNEIGELINKSEKSVDNALQRLRKKITNFS